MLNLVVPTLTPDRIASPEPASVVTFCAEPVTASASGTASSTPVHPERTNLVIALVPAHNEEDGITRTIASLKAQTRRVDLIVVMADNCTDQTVSLAAAAGAIVIETRGNTAKKAGALNQGLARVMPLLGPGDFVLCQDADGELAPDFVIEGLRTFDLVDRLGGLSGSVVARRANNLLESSQAIEYARGMRLMSRNGGRVHVLSGAATLFPYQALADVAAARGTALPGRRGQWFMEDSLTEDYELTLAIKTLGYACSSTRRCQVITDVMPTLEHLRVQRLRWYRGAMESLWLYGWTRLTHKVWLGIAWTFFVSLLFPLSVVVLAASWAAWGTLPDLRYTLLFPLFALEGIVTARRIDLRARVLAVTFFPLWIYDNVMFFLYWQALFHALHQKSRTWIT